MRWPWQHREPKADWSMPERFNALAEYNGERGRGIVHTPDTDTAMAVLQADFNKWIRAKTIEWAKAKGQAVIVTDDGLVVTLPAGTSDTAVAEMIEKMGGTRG